MTTTTLIVLVSLAIVAFILIKSFFTYRSSPAVDELNKVLQFKRNKSDQKVKEYKDAKEEFSRSYSEYLTSKSKPSTSDGSDDNKPSST